MYAFLIVAATGVTSTVRAQSALEFFHSGAKAYVGEELPEALNLVQSGLEIEPENARLIALKEKIEEEQENQQQEQGNNDQESSDNQENQQEDQQEQDSEQEQESEQENSDQQEQEQSGDPSEENEEQQQPESSNQEMPPDPDQLSKEQAERILQALENEEAKLLREVQKIKGRPRRVEKDW
ncbi:MAG: hypothetical protein HKN43_09715 [Rhodothermales bacterium]|nr:hypothetical protein [Rhodothermales bacterium]